MKRFIALISVLLCVLILLSACAEQTEPPAATAGESVTQAETQAETEPQTEPVTEPETEPETEPDTEPQTEPETEQPVIEPEMTLTGFDASLLKFVSEKTDGNFVVSPLSFKYALGLALAGANGETRDQLLAALGGDDRAFDDYIKDFNRFIEYFGHGSDLMKEDYDRSPDEFPSKPDDALKVADSVWKYKDLSPLKEDFRLMSEAFDARLFDFERDTVIEKVNEWTSEKTNGLIKKILSDGYDTSTLSVLIVNAVYFKDAWQHKFDDAGRGGFTAKDGTATEKDYIRSDDITCRYYEDGDTVLVSVPMRLNVSVTFIMGSADGFEEKLAKSQKRDVNLIIPKIDVETSLSDGQLCDFLKGLGVTAAFDGGKADFSRMLDDPVYIGGIVQKAKLKLDENGVESAASTALALNSYGIPKTVRFDRPFSFYIHTDKTDVTKLENVILFEGMIVR